MAINYRHTALAGLLLTGVVTFLTSCKEGDAIFSDINHPEADYVLEDPNSFVTVTLALNVSSQQDNGTRLPVDAIQHQGNNFRGLQDFTLIPFAVADPTASPDPVVKTDTPIDGSVNGLSRRENTYNYIDEQTVDVSIGTNAYLCYAKAIPTAPATKFYYGSTLPDYTTLTPQAITFNPDYICADASTAVSAAQALTDYLTTIANSSYTDGESNTTYWRTATHARLKTIFANFTNNVNGEQLVFAGSSVNVLALVNQLYGVVASLSFDPTANPTEYGIRQAILDNILATGVTPTYDTTDPTLVTGVEGLPTSMTGFPASTDLPDGAAALKWNSTSNAFELQTTSTSVTPINSLTQYVYPAELYYYDNSAIRTSNASQSVAYSNPNWSEVLAYYTTNNVVELSTRSIAIKDPMDYAVGCLEAYVWANSATLTDADFNNVELGTGIGYNNFPLTGFLLGGQYRQQFDFTPADSTKAEGIIYDKTLGNTVYLAPATDANGDGQPDNPSYFYTLSLQTFDETSVKIILEFQNNSDQPFRGRDGLVYPGTKFYLVGTISSPLNDRVITKDHITKIGIRINSLADAYNVIPDLLTVTREFNVVNIGITKWDDTSTGTKNIYNW